MKINSRTLVLSFATLLIGVTAYVLYNYDKRVNQSSVLPGNEVFQKIPPLTATGDQVIIKSDEVNARNNSYEYKGVVLTEEEIEDDRVQVYMTVNSQTIKLFQTYKDAPGGTYPQFKKTSDPNIALLHLASGDAGYFSEDFDIINLATKQIIQTNYNNGLTIIVVDAKGQTLKIEPNIDDPCGNVERKPEQAVLNDFLVNGQVAHVLQPITLKCIDPGGIGAIYSPSPAISIIGISRDLSKVYFNFSATNVIDKGNYNFDYSDKAWSDNYVFFITTGKIVKENPTDLLFSNSY